MPKSVIESQLVWRTLTKTETSGYFVWDVLEVIGEVDETASFTKDFVRCNDGSYVLPFCWHFWTEKSAMEALNREDMWQYVIVV